MSCVAEGLWWYCIRFNSLKANGVQKRYIMIAGRKLFEILLQMQDSKVELLHRCGEVDPGESEELEKERQ
jgi:hypothetical protein